MFRPGQPSVLMGTRRRKRAFGPRTQHDPLNLALAGCFVVLAVIGGIWLWNANKVSFSASGLEDGATVAPQQTVGLEFAIEVSPTSRLDSATVTVDGEEESEIIVVDATDEGWTFEAPPGEAIPEGEHTIEVRVPRAVTGTATWELEFEVRSP